MRPVRLALAVGSIALIDLAVANVLLWADSYWVPIGWYAAWLLVLAIFDVGQFRPRVDAASGAWHLAGERFFDPNTGEATTLFYDPVTGQRDYRRSM